MKNKGIGSAVIVVVVIVIAAAAVGGYMVMSGGESEESGGETLITENVAKLGFKPEKIKKYFENVEDFRLNYTQNPSNHPSTMVQTSAHPQTWYWIQGRYFKPLFSFKLENELTEGKAPAKFINNFKEAGIPFSENAVIVKNKYDKWFIVSQNENIYSRLKKENNELVVRKIQATFSVLTDLSKFSTVKKADNYYESWYGHLKQSWEKMHYNPEEKALEKYKNCAPEGQLGKVLEDGKITLGDESFVRYLENNLGKPYFGVTIRERNVVCGVKISGSVPCISEKAMELAKILENRLEKT